MHGLRGHPYKTWASSEGTGDERAGSSRWRLRIKSHLKSRTPPAEGNSTQAGVLLRQQEVFWPKDYLANDIPEARVWTYGYNADVIGGLFQANNKNSVSGHGRDLKARFERDLGNEVNLILCKGLKLKILLEVRIL